MMEQVEPLFSGMNPISDHTESKSPGTIDLGMMMKVFSCAF